MQRPIDTALLQNEFTFYASRSGGPGGQHVNKVSTKITLQFDVQGSQILTTEEKETIKSKLAAKINTEGILQISAQESRTQLQNKAAAMMKFDKLMHAAFVKRKRRVRTKPTTGSVQKNAETKKRHSEKKLWRQKLR